MHCIRTIKAGFDRSGSLTFKPKLLSNELQSFEFACRKCLPCRLNIAREKAIRCIHEAKMHQNNLFLILTYNDENLGNGRLNYLDFQLFMKRLRESINRYVTDKELKEKLHVSFMVTGEYGDKTKRPHWHAIIFNYRPADAKYKYSTHNDEKVYTSEFLTQLWGKGNIEFGSVTMDSAGYVARYAAKKLGHGNDQDHDYHPIHKTSSKHAIGKRWLEKYYKDVFTKGFVLLPNGQKAGIPRYYTDWVKKNDMALYLNTAPIRAEAAALAENQKYQDTLEYLENCRLQSEQEFGKNTPPLTKTNVKQTILKQKFKQLQERLKL